MQETKKQRKRQKAQIRFQGVTRRSLTTNHYQRKEVEAEDQDQRETNNIKQPSFAALKVVKWFNHGHFIGGLTQLVLCKDSGFGGRRFEGTSPVQKVEGFLRFIDSLTLRKRAMTHVKP